MFSKLVNDGSKIQAAEQKGINTLTSFPESWEQDKMETGVE